MKFKRGKQKQKQKTKNITKTNEHTNKETTKREKAEVLTTVEPPKTDPPKERTTSLQRTKSVASIEITTAKPTSEKRMLFLDSGQDRYSRAQT